MPGGPAHRYEDRVTKKRKVDDDAQQTHHPSKYRIARDVESDKRLLTKILKELWFAAFERSWQRGTQDRNHEYFEGKIVSRQHYLLLRNIRQLGKNENAVDAVQAFTSFYGKDNNFFRISVLLPYGFHAKGDHEFQSDALRDLNGVPSTAVGTTFSNEFSQNFVENFINASPLKAQIQQRFRQLVRNPLWLDSTLVPKFKNVFFRAHQQIQELSFKDVSLEFKDLRFAPWSETVESITLFYVQINLDLDVTGWQNLSETDLKSLQEQYYTSSNSIVIGNNDNENYLPEQRRML